MIGFILRRLGYGIMVVLGVVFVVFFLFHVLPGDPVGVLVGEHGSKEVRENITKDLGLNKSLPVQFAYYLNDLSPISVHTDNKAHQEKYKYFTLLPVGKRTLVVKYPYLRRSYRTNKKVSEILMENIGATLVLAVVSMFFATLIGIVFGIFAALNQNTFVDYSLVTISVLGISTPSFVMAITISVIFGYYLKDYTGLSHIGSLWETSIEGTTLKLKNLILPATTLALRPLAIIVQLTRSSMLDVMSQDYIRTARAKGLLFYRVVAKHALKNALNPVITAVSGWLASLMAGTFFIEYVFDWKGLGYTIIKAVEDRDLPIIMGTTIFIACIFVVINILVDILYSTIDPRIKLK
ncbi:ABC transporter permease [Microscilla marina]|uniref:Peptide ABC transporter, permease protein n=1 Tax=Microscilla marina ATCC 23134 TaxID=313606 RepID=A1ZT42_MICM2|nr:ABC transporter permease [Microscilla marina]EAY26432.1 peptide ABC transporter, permease protein [Microscilla marina ATCC 23134]